MSNIDLEKRREKRRRYRKNQPEKVRESWKRYRLKYLDKERERNHLYYLKNEEKEKQRSKKKWKIWYEKNRTKRRWYNKEWYRKRRVGGDIIRRQDWEDLKKSNDHKCIFCKKSEPDIRLTMDHIVPMSKGGKNILANIQPLCRSCNCSKKDKYQP